MYFEIKNNKIEKKTINNDKLDHNFFYFNFLTKEWVHKEKYIIFWIDKNKTVIKSLGKKCKSKISAPKELNPKSFLIQIYVDDSIKTDKYTVGVPIEEKEINECSRPSNKTIGLIQKIYDSLDTKIDDVLYSDNVLKFYANEEVIKTIDLVDKRLIEKILKGKIDINVDSKLSLKSRNPVQNKVITEELEKKQDSSTLPKVAQTGDYNDLKNIPTEFNPKHHNHVIVDVVDYEENIEFDLGELLDSLYDEIVKE